MLKQKYFLTDFFILSAEKQPIKSSWRKIVCLRKKMIYENITMKLTAEFSQNVGIFFEKIDELDS